MVEFSGGPGGLIEHGFSNSVFIIPGVIILALSGSVIWFNVGILFLQREAILFFCGYKLFLCLSEREKKREEKKKLKQKKKK